MVKYLFCDECNGYYVLDSGESPDELSDKCECGGKLLLGEMKTDDEKYKAKLMAELIIRQKHIDRDRKRKVDQDIYKDSSSFLSSIDFFSAIALGGVLGFFSLFLIPVGSVFIVFVISSFITSLIIMKDANIPSFVIPKIINDNSKFRRVYAGIITSIIIGGLIGLGMGAMAISGPVGVSSSTFLIQVFLGMLFFMIIGLILGVIGGFLGVFTRDFLSTFK